MLGRVQAFVRSLTLANLIANIGIVITGGAVRLTGSGMGCPTWPKCTDASYVLEDALDINQRIEFGNRVLSIIVGMIAVGTVIALWRHPQRLLARWVLAGVLFQGMLGGLTVRFHLSPYFVGPHFLFSMALIALSYVLWRRCSPPVARDETRLRPLAWVVTMVSAAVLMIGVVVTGSGPHSGDAEAVRTGLDPEMISQLHVDAVFLLLGLTVALWFAARALRAPAVARATAVLLGVSLSQGTIGFVQYFTNLPIVLVGFHIFGACLVWVATLGVLYATGLVQTDRSDGTDVQVREDAPELVTI
jgi:cytochrome c oxidase assembly protein subunit 15